jgi:Sel1 repeat
MNLQLTKRIAISAILLLSLNGCSSTKETSSGMQPLEGAAPGTSKSFSSSAVCADNPFLQKYQCSFSRIEQAARSGDPDAQYALGYLYYYGVGTTQDRQTGLMWIRKAAAQGQTVAQEALRALSSGSTAHSVSSSNSNSAPATTQPAAQSQPARPLTDYLPNYGEKRINTTETPPSVNLSTPSSTGD